MPLPRPDRDAWLAAGGSVERLAILEQLGAVAGFARDGARCLAAIHPDRPEVGTLADWIGRGGAATAVRSAAESWLADQGCAEIRAPMYMTPWFDHASNVGPLDMEPLLFEPTEPGEQWVEAGYGVHATYASILAEHGENITAGMNAAGRLASRGWSLHPLDLKNDFDEAVHVVHDILHQAHRDMEGYTHVPVELWAAWYRERARTIPDPVLSRVAVHPTDGPVGYILAFPEPVSVFTIPSLAVVPEHRNAGLASWMVATAHQQARKAGIESGVHAMVRYGVGTREDTTWYRGEIVRRYALFGKQIR